MLRYGVRFDQGAARRRGRRRRRAGPPAVAPERQQRDRLRDAALPCPGRTRSPTPTSTPVAGADARRRRGRLVRRGRLPEVHPLDRVRRRPALHRCPRPRQPGAGRRCLAEARHGIDWLDKMWDSTDQVLYLQVGVGSGNSAGTFRGDHDGWRLPQADDGNTATEGPVRLAPSGVPRRGARPADQPEPRRPGRRRRSPLRHKQMRRRIRRARSTSTTQATSLYAMAQTTGLRGRLTTALPFAFYPESSWHDDMELGATEIARAAAGARHRRRAALPAGRRPLGEGLPARTTRAATPSTSTTPPRSPHTDLIRTMGAGIARRHQGAVARRPAAPAQRRAAALGRTIRSLPVSTTPSSTSTRTRSG